MDKFSVLVDTIKYMKELKKRLEVLEEQNKRIKLESSVVLTKPDHCNDDDERNESVVDSIFQVEAEVLGKYMLIRIQCKEHKGLLVKIMVEIQRFQLCVVNSSVLPFGDSILDITIIAQVVTVSITIFILTDLFLNIIKVFYSRLFSNIFA